MINVIPRSDHGITHTRALSAPRNWTPAFAGGACVRVGQSAAGNIGAFPLRMHAWLSMPPCANAKERRVSARARARWGEEGSYV